MNHENGHELAPIDNSSPYQIIPLDQIQDLEHAEVAPVDIMADYWTPSHAGESKKVIFQRIAPWKVIDQNTAEVIELPCVFFATTENGQLRMIRNGSKKLVAAFEGNGIPAGTGWEITYRGKKRNRTNQFSSDDWVIKPLQYNVARKDINQPLHDIDTRGAAPDQ